MLLFIVRLSGKQEEAGLLLKLLYEIDLRFPIHDLLNIFMIFV